MRSSAIILSLVASLAIASPLHKVLDLNDDALKKRELLVETKIEIVYKTVTAGAAGETAPPPPPEPTTSASPPPPPPVELPKPITTSQEPAPEPTPEPTPTPAPAPAPAPEPAPKPEPKPEPKIEAPAPPAVVSQAAAKIIDYSKGSDKGSNDGGYSAPSTDGLDDAAKAILDAHNAARAKHSAGSLQWDADLAQSAKTLAQSCKMVHNTNIGGGGYGQNLGASSGSDQKSAMMTAFGGWMKEAGNYDFGAGMAMSGKGFMDIGHFTQVVWKQSTSVGCAAVSCPSGIGMPDGSSMGGPAMNVACNYKSPGNFNNAYKQNVA